METERLILRKPSVKEDAEFFLRLYNSPSFILNVGDRNLRTIEDAEKYIMEKFLPHFEKYGFGNFLIVRKEDGEKLGGVGIFVRDGLDVPDIGFSFLEEFQGKGYGFEAASALLKKAFSDYGITEVSAITIEENVASQNLIKKLGLQFQKKINLPDDPVDLLYFYRKK